MKRFIAIDRRLVIIIASVFAFGFFAHGMALFNKISIHDDTVNILTSPGIRSGRWAGEFLDTYFLTPVFDLFISTPLFNGILAFVVIALSVYILCVHFEIKTTIIMVALSGICVTFPSITSLFGYVYTIHPYMIAVLLCLIGSCLICKDNIWLNLLGIIIVGFSIGVYQVYLTFALSFLLCDLLKIIIDDCSNIKQFVTSATKYVLCIILAFGFYWGIELLRIKQTGIVLTTYQGISEGMDISFRDVLQRIPIAYQMFINPDSSKSSDCFPLWTRNIYHIVCIIALILTIFLIYHYRKDIAKCVEIVLCIAVAPLAINIIYVMCDREKSNIYSIMLNGYVSLYFLVLFLSDRSKSFFWGGQLKTGSLLKTGCLVLIFLSVVLYGRFSNMCYTKAIFMQQQAISYFTTLRARIEMTPGYHEDIPVIYINESKKKTNNIVQPEGFDSIHIAPFAENEIINDYAWRRFMSLWCGYRPNYSRDNEINDFQSKQEVQDMPSYPQDGSVQIIDNAIVVKF